MKKSKGQIISLDFIVSMSLFTFIIAMSIFIWNNLNTQIDEGEKNNMLQTELVSISTMLIETPGTPSNWNSLSPSEISQLGLAVSSNVLSSDKVAALTSLDYYDTKKILGLNFEEIYIEFTDIDGNLLNIKGRDMNFSSFPKSDSSIFGISRPIIIENDGIRSIGKMNMYLWVTV
jgi:hypothetical protein